MKRLFAILALLPCGLGAVLAHDPWLSWTTYQSRHFDIHAHEGLEALAPRVAADCEHEFTRLARLFKFRPSSRIDVVLADETDEANGAATPYPRNETFFVVAPFDLLQGADEFDDWLRYLASHELTHIFHLDRAKGFPRIMRKIFGRIPLFMPNLYQPSWVIEGLAAWNETSPTARVGRGQSSYFKGLMRMEVLGGLKPLREINQPLEAYPAGTTRYLYGVYFMNFLEARYGKDSLRRWVENYSDDWIPYFINRNARKAFGKDLDQLYDEFQIWLLEQFQPEIDAIQKAGPRGAKAEGPDSGAYYWGPMKGHFAVRNDGISQARLQELDGSQWRDVTDMNSNRFSPGPGRILVIESGWIEQSCWSTDLFSVDAQSHAKTRLSSGLRVREAVDMKAGIVALAGEAGQKRLLLLGPDGVILKKLWQGKDGENPSTLAASPDGLRLLSSIWRKNKGWDLVEFDFEKADWRDLAARPEQEISPAWSPDGKDIYFSADYGGIFNIWKLGVPGAEPLQVSRVIGGALYPTCLDGQTLDFTLLTPQGNERGELKLADALGAPLSLTLPVAGALSPVAEIAVSSSPYSPLSTMGPPFWLPAAAGGSLGEYIGIQLFGADILERHQYELSLMAGLSPTVDVFGSLNYAYTRYLPLWGFGLSRSPDEEPAGSGHLRVNERWDAAVLLPWSTAWSDWALQATASGRRGWDYWRASGTAEAGELKETLFSVAAGYDSTRIHAKSIGAADGISTQVSWTRLNPQLDNDAAWVGASFSRPTSIGGLNILEMSVNGGSISQGNMAFSLSQPPLPSQTGPSYRPGFQLAGYDRWLPDLTGASAASAHLGWRFPIADIERGWMAPPLGVDKIFGRIYGESGRAWYGNDAAGPWRSSVGAELDTILVLGYEAGLLLRIGYAHGTDADAASQVYVDLGGLLLSWTGMFPRAASKALGNAR